MQNSGWWLVLSRRRVVEATAILVGGSVLDVPTALATGESVAGVERLETQTRPLGASISREPLLVRVDHLPPGKTYFSMRRMKFDGGASLAVLPIDGPVLIAVEAGRVSLELTRGGATVYRGAVLAASEPLASNEVHTLDIGDLAVIPAGIPLRFANGEPSPARWIQFQAETPATECPCGADLTGIRSELLDSVTSETPLAVPADLAFSIGQLEPGAARERRAGTDVALIGPIEPGAVELIRETDGSLTNRGTTPIGVYTMTLRPARLTT